MNVVDACGWLEYFTDGPNAERFAPAIEDPASLIVPAICLYEVYKRTAEQRGAVAALTVTAAMRQSRVVALDGDLAVVAAQTSSAERLAMADALILATARSLGATLWTQDGHFEGLVGVKYWPNVSTPLSVAKKTNLR